MGILMAANLCSSDQTVCSTLQLPPLY